MTNKKTLKSALLMSIIAVLVCCVMLVSTTFAWFTSEAKSGDSTIVAGNLKVGLVYNPDGEWKDAEGKELFDSTALTGWTPGAMAYSYTFKVVNNGSLALKYSISVEMKDIVTNEGHGLSEVLKYKIVTASMIDDINEGTPAAEIWAGLYGSAAVGTLEDNVTETEELVAVIYWDPSANDEIYNASKALETKFNISVFATQMSSSVGSYDRVHTTISNGVDLLNNTDMGVYAHLSDLVKVAEDHYVSYVSLDAATIKENEVNISAVYFDIAAPLFDEVIARKADISSMTVILNDYPAGEDNVIPGGDDLDEAAIMTAIFAGLDPFITEYLNKKKAEWILAGSPDGEEPTLGSAGAMYIDELAKYDVSINVTVTTIDGVSTTYTLDFVTAPVSSDESQAICEAVAQGVNDSNTTMEKLEAKLIEQGLLDEDSLGTIRLSELEYINGKYCSTVTFKGCTDVGKQVFNGYSLINDLIQAAVDEQRDNIDSIYVGGIKADLDQAGWLTMALGFWGLFDVVTEEQFNHFWNDFGYSSMTPDQLFEVAVAILENLNGHSCDVVIVDKLGNSVTYTLSFEFIDCNLDFENLDIVFIGID